MHQLGMAVHYSSWLLRQQPEQQDLSWAVARSPSTGLFAQNCIFAPGVMWLLLAGLCVRLQSWLLCVWAVPGGCCLGSWGGQAQPPAPSPGGWRAAIASGEQCKSRHQHRGTHLVTKLVDNVACTENLHAVYAVG